MIVVLAGTTTAIEGTLYSAGDTYSVIIPAAATDTYRPKTATVTPITVPRWDDYTALASVAARLEGPRITAVAMKTRLRAAGVDPDRS